MTKVKICGLMHMSDIRAVNQYMPDYAGFILSMPFRRYVDIDELAAMRRQLDRRIKAVGVFVNEQIDYIFEYLEKHLIDIVQLHGDENNDYILELKREYPLIPVIRAFEVRDETDIEAAKRSLADLVLLDAGKGSGKTFSWELLKDFRQPYVLAGGLSPDNIHEALKQTDPWCVDTSSGVETDGRKDPEKIRRFIEAVREN